MTRYLVRLSRTVKEYGTVVVDDTEHDVLDKFEASDVALDVAMDEWHWDGYTLEVESVDAY